MVWEKRHLIDGIEGWEHKTTHSTIHIERHQEWDVILDEKIIHSVPSELEANDLMNQYIETH